MQPGLHQKHIIPQVKQTTEKIVFLQVWKFRFVHFFFLRLRTQKILPNILDHIHFFKKFISFKEVIKRQLFTLLRSKTLISPKKLSAIKVKFDLLAEIHLPKPSMYINVY